MRFTIFFILLFIFKTTYCCSCINLNVKTAYKQFDIIVAAKIIEIIEPTKDTIETKDSSILFVQNVFGSSIKLELISIYKGKKIAKYITISLNETNCEYPFRIGTQHLIYAREINGNILTSICTRTYLLKENKDLYFLKKKYKKCRTKKALKDISN